MFVNIMVIIEKKFFSKTEKWIDPLNLDDLYKPTLQLDNLLNHPKTGQFNLILNKLINHSNLDG